MPVEPQTNSLELTISAAKPMTSQNMADFMLVFSISAASSSSTTASPLSLESRNIKYKAMIRATIRMAASMRFSSRSISVRPPMMLTNSSSGSSFFNNERCRAIGAISAVTPRTSRILVMFEPSALPMARLPAPSIAAIAETNISGAEVPIETMVRPTSNGDMPR